MASPAVPPPVVKPKALYCPNCGGPVERRGFGHTLTIVCPSCLTVLDASTPLLQVLQRIEKKYARTPKIPLGSRGNFAGATWEVIGFQTRGVTSDGVFYEWEEYLLFNPYRGFRYLTHYQGHWNWVETLESIPAQRPGIGTVTLLYGGHTFKHFSGAPAVTTFVLGEFPWRVQAGETVRADDYVSPPYILSAESSDQERTWSYGSYVAGADVWKAFRLPGSPPPPQGVYLNQPSPYTGRVGSYWKTAFLMLGVLLVLAIASSILTRQETVLDQSYHFAQSATGEPSFVTREFDLTGRAANVELDIATDLSNNWAYFNFALINESTGEAYDFGREVSYYFGADSDGSWTEGSSADKVLLPPVPAGRYYLRVEPEMDAGAVDYRITLRHDVPNMVWFIIAGGLLLIPPVLFSIRAAKFEGKRWAESDHAPSSSSSNDDDDDDD